jgi:hypothetical protein
LSRSDKIDPPARLSPGEGHSTENKTMRLSLLSLAVLAGLCSLTAGPAAVGATRMSVVRPDSPIAEVYYYYHGHRYAYHYNHRYYNHRRYQNGRYYYY